MGVYCKLCASLLQNVGYCPRATPRLRAAVFPLSRSQYRVLPWHAQTPTERIWGVCRNMDFLCQLSVAASFHLFQNFDAFQWHVTAKKGERITPSTSPQGKSPLLFSSCFLYGSIQASTMEDQYSREFKYSDICPSVLTCRWAAEKLCLQTIVNRLTGQVVCQVRPHAI